ncbi:MAG: aldo/keto reductase [Methanomassiliicoccales archaeon]|nr:aldo/keto reductase [Methanomassiliicoccales archaeon]
MEYRKLGRSDLIVSSVGLGAWQWGSGSYWGYGERYGRDDVARIWDKAVEQGVNFIDTAEIYGWGMSEQVIGEIIQKDKRPIIASKYWPFKLSSDFVYRSVRKSLRRLKVDSIDLYQVHYPNPTNSLRKLMRNLERLVKDGKIRYIGLSNFGVKGLEEARSALSFCDVVSDQVHYSLLARKPEFDGTIEYCKKNDIGIIAWSPLEQGLLTGKYRPGVKVSGIRRLRPAFSERGLRRLKPSLDELEAVSARHSRTPAQTAINWLLREDNVVAIPGASGPKQIEDNCGAVGWALSEEENQRLEKAFNGCIGRA